MRDLKSVIFQEATLIEHTVKLSSTTGYKHLLLSGLSIHFSDTYESAYKLCSVHRLGLAHG